MYNSAQVVVGVFKVKLSILTRVLQRQLKLEEDTGDIDPYTQHWTLE